MHSYRFGIEEEYFVVNRKTGALRSEMPREFLNAAQKQLGPHLMKELLQSKSRQSRTL